MCGKATVHVLAQKNAYYITLWSPYSCVPQSVGLQRNLTASELTVFMLLAGEKFLEYRVLLEEHLSLH